MTDNVNATLGAIFQDVSADGHGDINLGVGDLKQVRFENESLDDRWYQVALTVNASLPFGDAMVTASYFDRDFRYEGDATDYEFRFNDNFVNAFRRLLRRTSPVYDFGGDPRGFATNHEATRITTVEARLASRADSESRWGWLAGAFYSQEREHTEFDSYVRDYQDTGRSRISATSSRPITTSAIRSRRPSAGSSAATTPNSTRSPCSAS